MKMRTSPSNASLRALCFLTVFACGVLLAGDQPPPRPDGKTARLDIMKVGPEGVVMKENGREKTVPLDEMPPRLVAAFYKQMPTTTSAATRLGMGQYFLKNKLLAEAEEELNGAVKLDPACKDKAAPLLKEVAALKQAGADGKKEPGPRPADAAPGKEADGGDEEDFARQFLTAEVPARSETEMKAFLTKRLEELKTVGGAWRMKETKHFFCFSDVPEMKHSLLCQWNEELYDRLCQVLKHKEGDKLWNNKMPIYYFESFAQFQKFAVEVDKSPGSAMSGGYFSPHGRDVHICIPFMSERYKTDPKSQDRMARATLHHECTHAFLQLSGENVRLRKWLHEGLAQFIEFWYDPQNNPARRDRVAFLMQMVQRSGVPSWESMRDRPMGGQDIEGYSFAWAKFEFFYRNFPDNQKLPQMIRLIKAGKPENEAMGTAFGFPADKLEEGYKQWIKVQAKKGFNFGP